MKVVRPYGDTMDDGKVQLSFTLPVPDGDVLDLGEVRLASGKRVHAFAVDAELDLTGHRVAEVSNTFELHGRRYPEIDRAEWVDLDVARVRLNAAQVPLLDRLGP